MSNNNVKNMGKIIESDGGMEQAFANFVSEILYRPNHKFTDEQYDKDGVQLCEIFKYNFKGYVDVVSYTHDASNCGYINIAYLNFLGIFADENGVFRKVIGNDNSFNVFDYIIDKTDTSAKFNINDLSKDNLERLTTDYDTYMNIVKTIKESVNNGSIKTYNEIANMCLDANPIFIKNRLAICTSDVYESTFKMLYGDGGTKNDVLINAKTMDVTYERDKSLLLKDIETIVTSIKQGIVLEDVLTFFRVGKYDNVFIFAQDEVYNLVKDFDVKTIIRFLMDNHEKIFVHKIGQMFSHLNIGDVISKSNKQLLFEALRNGDEEKKKEYLESI